MLEPLAWPIGKLGMSSIPKTTKLTIGVKKVILCIAWKGTINELKDGTSSYLKKGMSYIVSDTLSSHRSTTKNGVHLLIIDGDFLKFPV